MLDLNRLTRRTFLTAGGLAALAALSGGCATRSATPARAAVNSGTRARPRPDLLDANSPKDLEVIQLTTEPDVPGSHLYMEAQVFTMDSKRFVLHRSATAHGSSKTDPKHQYLLCDLEDNYALHPLTEEVGATAPSVAPDGQSMYYFVNETELASGRLSLKRVNLDGTQRQTILVLDAPLPGTSFRPSRIYPLSTISSDGRRLALSAFLGDGRTEPGPFGLMVFDLVKATVVVVIHGPAWCNMHPQYCRSTEPASSHDILIQENHGSVADAAGSVSRKVGGAGADIHLIRDDGSNFRNLPWGRDGVEFCQGHQCWRGRTTWAITSTQTGPQAQLIESQAVPPAGHIGLRTPGGIRNHLTRSFPNPQFHHFATDIRGQKLISDAEPFNLGGRIYLAELGAPGRDPLRNFKYLLNPKASGKKQAHIHPFLSPNGALGFFNSDESGLLQAYLVRGF